MSLCNFTSIIDENKCIGDTLPTINSNFNTLDTELCTLKTNVTTLSSETLAIYPAVTTSAFTPKVWASINGTRNSSNTSGSVAGQSVYLKSKYNVSSVTKNNDGVYTVNIPSPLSNTDYLVSITGYGFTDIRVTTKNIFFFTFECRNIAGTLTDNQDLNIIVFNN